MTTVNLRETGTDPQFPTRGGLVGTAEVEGTPMLLSILAYSEGGHRFFLLAPAQSQEYIEVVPVKPASSTLGPQ